MKIAAIGPATKKAIESHGLKVNVVPTEYVAESVVKSLRRKVAGKRVLLARAKVARDVIPRELRKLGAQVDVVEAYETVIPRSSRARLRAVLKDPKRCPHVITFTSSSTARNFSQLARKERVARTPSSAVCLDRPSDFSNSPRTWLPVDVEAEEYTIPGLIAAIIKSVE